MQLFCMIYMVKTKRHTFLEQVLASGVVIEQVELNNPEVKGNEVRPSSPARTQLGLASGNQRWQSFRNRGGACEDCHPVEHRVPGGCYDHLRVPKATAQAGRRHSVDINSLAGCRRTLEHAGLDGKKAQATGRLMLNATLELCYVNTAVDPHQCGL